MGEFAPFLGLADGEGWQATPVDLGPGDQLVLYTDGVTDAVGETERFGEARLAEALCDSASAEDTVRRVHGALRKFAAVRSPTTRRSWRWSGCRRGIGRASRRGRGPTLHLSVLSRSVHPGATVPAMSWAGDR